MIVWMQGLFVTGTGTGVGKSIVAAALCAALVAEGREVVASKPLLSGLAEQPAPPWPHDHELLALVTGAPAEEIAPTRFDPAVSPHLAARLAGTPIVIDDLVAGIRARLAGGEVVVVEGAGGLLVPTDDEGTTMADLAVALGFPLVVVASPGLGTINHVQLTLEAARSRGLDIAAVVLTPWPVAPTPVELDNRALLLARTGVAVPMLGFVRGPDPSLLAEAGLAAGLHRLI